jgi:hypothetical protein
MPLAMLAAGLALVLAVAQPAATQPAGRVDPNPDASVEIEQVRLGLLAIGASVGGGRIRFRGEEHPFSVRGIEFGTVGVSTLSATGEVFGLQQLADFAGRYTEEVMPRPEGVTGGPEVRWLRNEAGVQLRLRTDRTGGQFRFSDAGVTIELR